MRWKRRRIAKARKNGRLFGAGAARRAEREKAHEAGLSVESRVGLITGLADARAGRISGRTPRTQPIISIPAGNGLTTASVDIETLRAMPEETPAKKDRRGLGGKPRRSVKGKKS